MECGNFTLVKVLAGFWKLGKEKTNLSLKKIKVPGNSEKDSRRQELKWKRLTAIEKQ